MVKFSLICASLIGSALAIPSHLVPRAPVPSNDGFPNPTTQQQILAIEQPAHGTLPNGPPPPAGAVNNDTLTSLQLIVFNELFETAYFSNLLYNVTHNVTGYVLNDTDYRTFVMKGLHAIVHQEELHALAANSILKSQNVTTIQPCGNYTFPVTNFLDAVTLAQTFTDLVLGTLQDVSSRAALVGLASFVQTIASIIAQEGEQVGSFRVIQKKIPSAQPFLTNSARAYAWSALQMFFVPSTCPSLNVVKLPLFAPLMVTTAKPTINTTSLQYSFDLSTLSKAKLPSNVTWTSSTNFSQVASVVYVSGQNLPVTVPISSYSTSGSMVTLSASFPGYSNLFYGLTIASVVSGTGNFSSVGAAVNQTVFAPGLIEIE